MSLGQLRTPDEMRGRVSAANALFIGAANQLGDCESGLVAALGGAGPAVATTADISPVPVDNWSLRRPAPSVSASARAMPPPSPLPTFHSHGRPGTATATSSATAGTPVST